MQVSGQAENSPQASTTLPPLFVDLDGTLLASDVIPESLIAVCRTNPRTIPRLVAALFAGRAYFKHVLSQAAVLDPAVLPYRETVLEWIRNALAKGQRVLLATATHRDVAQRIADHLGLFDVVIGSCDQVNRKGAAKLEAICDWCRQHGYDRFAYMGDSRADLPIWQAAEHRIAVAPSARLAKELLRFGDANVISEHSRSTRLRAWFRALRPHQWSKNLLVFVPPLCGHQLGNVGQATSAIIAFVVLSLAASGVYVLNDVFDVHSDRLHARKRRRPFASGLLPLTHGPPVATALILLALIVSVATLGMAVAASVLGYLLVTTLYTVWLKRKLLVDVMTLAGLYTLRLIVGGLATSTMPSQWLLAFSMFLFASLAFAKRYTEVASLVAASDSPRLLPGRGYRTEDHQVILSVGPASGYMSVLVLALYISNADIIKNYQRPYFLWLLCPLLMYWITRIWFIAARGNMHDDPLVFAIRDRISIAVGGIGLLMFLAAM